jgi:putative peptide zinc metalloprotease protein
LPIDRPTFHESWYRVADLHPRLRSTAQTVRQHYRGQLWYIVQDPANNQFFRLSREGYIFLGLLDGRRTVAQAWELANRQLGDGAPTQGEAIGLLGQLHSANLLQTDLSPDAANLFDRYKKRVRREIGSYFLNFMFPRFPLLNPDRFLDRWAGLVGWVFSWVGLAFWVVLVAVGFSCVASHWSEFWQRSQPQEMLKTDNLLLLYLAFALIKTIHEFGHSFACKHFGRRQNMGGRVHAMGVMLLVFMPCPYMDASSAWVLRNKWHRAIIGAAGMYVELAVASVAAVIWSLTGHDSAVHAIAQNAIFVASVSTVLFNANPLLRYDGYYILSDLLEIPNLAQRSKDYLYYLVRRYAFGVARIVPQPQTNSEKTWLVIYGLASGIYRIVVSVTIIFFVADKLLLVGALMAVGGVVGWVLVPLGQFIYYLTTGPELTRVRGRAVGVTLGVAVLLALVLGVIPVTEHQRADGVAEALPMREVYAGADGFVTSVLPDGSDARPDGAPLLRADNQELQARLIQAEAACRAARAQFNNALAGDEPAIAQALGDELRALDHQRRELADEVARLVVRAPIAGRWCAWDADSLPGSYLRRGQHIGTLANPDLLIIRVSADQTLGPRIRELSKRAKVSLRVDGRPGDEFGGVIEKVLDSGQQRLPSAALGLHAGGQLAVEPDDQAGGARTGEPGEQTGKAQYRAVEPFFEVQITPSARAADCPLPGQRVVARFSLPARPLVFQGWDALLQLLQRRFKI